MLSAQRLVNLPVISVSEGDEIGKVNDLYLDSELKHVTAISLDNEEPFNELNCYVRQADVLSIDQDAILVQNSDFVLDEVETPELSEWLKRWIRREDLRGRKVIAPDGTRIGHIGDIVLGDKADIVGFNLQQGVGQQVANKFVSRSSLIKTDNGQSDNNTIVVKMAVEE